MDNRPALERPFWFWDCWNCGHATTQMCDPVELPRLRCAGCGQLYVREKDNTFTPVSEAIHEET